MGSVGAMLNEPGAAFRLHLNSALQELARWYAGATAPDPLYAHMFWFDTGTLAIKRRNAANTAWATVGAFAADGTVTWYVAGVALGNFATLKANFAGTTDPGAGDDAEDGFAAGSLWLNVTGGRAWICRVATAGVADWRQITAAVFSQDTAGLVPGPTAAEIAAGRVLGAAGWVLPEWAALQTIAPPTAAAAIDLTDGAPGSFRRLRVRADGLGLTLSAAITLQLRVGGSWKTGSADYDWTGTYVTGGSQVQTDATAGSVPLSYSGWPATGEIGGEIAVTTQGARPIIKARGAYIHSGGRRGLFNLDVYCNFTGAVDGVRFSASAGTFTVAGRLIMEGGAT